MSVILVNGRLVPDGEAALSPLDRGFLYGDGCFETLRARQGRVIEVEAHLARLERSAGLLGIPLAAYWGRRALEEQVAEALASVRASEALVRLTASRGVALRLGLSPVLAVPPPTLVVVADVVSPAASPKPACALIVSRYRRIPDRCVPAAAKVTHYLPAILATAEALAAGADDAVLLSTRGKLAETTVANLFWVRGDCVFTPNETVGLLPGITRARIMALARQEGLEVREVVAGPRDLAAAQEVFLTKTSVGVLPVRQVGRRRLDLGPTSRGPVTAWLQRAYERFYDIA